MGRRLLGVLFLGGAVYYGIWGGEYSAPDLWRLRQQQEQEIERLTDLHEELDSLRQMVERLEDDPATIERVARERFGMIREGEVLYRFVEVGLDEAAERAHHAP